MTNRDARALAERIAGLVSPIIVEELADMQAVGPTVIIRADHQVIAAAEGVAQALSGLDQARYTIRETHARRLLEQRAKALRKALRTRRVERHDG
ncbi:MAG: hypothetical protein ABJG86_09845 [Nitratireductor sp.]|uniref:hypothetical protein n=1 Tax=Parvibaculum sp. TaxID=2024848 RepID=UPI00327F93A6